MPLSFNGIGTRYYGHAEESDSGSYTATEWIIFLWLPIAPLRSWRVSQRRKGMDTFLYSNAKYMVKPQPLNRRQVLLGYLCTIVAVAIMVVIWVFVRRA
ncbi:MAG TPA: hypothetical protein VGI30_01250 [Caulobacteraceae bacterium]|jgi:hypothetical protein